MRVMLFGAGGMLGRDLADSAPQGVELIALTRAQLDITEDKAVEQAVGDARPDVIVNAAAYTAVDKAEASRDRAFAVNGAAPGCIGRAAVRVGARVVHFSTDYVFDGAATAPYAEDAATNPINAYGASKLAGEQALLHTGATLLLIRTQWLFGDHGPCFPRTMLDRAHRRLPTMVVADQRGRPTYARDLAEVTWRLAGAACGGVWHVANGDPTAWYDVAKAVFESRRAPDLVSPCSTSEYPTPAQRPRRAILDTTKIERHLGAPMRSWRLALDEFLAKARNRSSISLAEGLGPDARST